MLSVMGVMCTLNTLNELPETVSTWMMRGYWGSEDGPLCHARSSPGVNPGSYSSLGLTF